MIRSDRQLYEVELSKGGGAFVAVDNDLIIDVLDPSCITNTLVNIEIVCCKCFLNDHFVLYVYVTYCTSTN